MKRLRVDADRIEELKNFDFEEMDNCFYKFIGVTDWVLRVEKKTAELKLWNFANGGEKDPTPYIHDLIKNGLIKS